MEPFVQKPVLRVTSFGHLRAAEPRLFAVHFDNRKRQIHGYHQAYDAEGTRYSDGRVHVNTSDFPQRDFETLHAMKEAFAEYGECCVTWLDERYVDDTLIGKD